MAKSKMQCYCKKCNKIMLETQFYSSLNKEKYPDGKLDICKNCITMHVNNWDCDTFKWILQEIDIPYVPEEWSKLLAKYGRDPSQVTGLTIIGRYISAMKLNQWKDFRFKDTDFLQQRRDNEIMESMKRQGFDGQDIAVQLEKSHQLDEATKPVTPEDLGPQVRPETKIQQEMDEIDLTEEERTMLRLKWGRTYTPDEWVRLEQLYEDMMASYDIQGAAHVDTLKLICKASLKANQLIDLGDKPN